MPWTHKMKHWYTFWNPNLIRDFTEFDDNYCSQTYTDDKGEIQTGQFHKRFIDIFGADGAKGTMSAQYLLNTIPYELYGDDYKGYSDNYKAFIVLAIFKSMMEYNTSYTIQPNLFHIKTGKFNNTNPCNNINTSLFKGWLCQMYTKSVMCLISKVENNVFLFSHAGMPIENNFLEGLKAYSDLDLTDDATKLTNINHRTLSKEKKNMRVLLTGGAPETIEKLNSIVQEYNNYFKDTLIDPIVVNTEKGSVNGVPTNEMVQLLAYTSGYSKETKKYSSASGPVNLEDWKTTDTHYRIDDMKVHQIHGHSPQGFGCDIIPLIQGNVFYGSIVNLDNSNTFMSNNRRQYGDDSINKKSYNYLEIDTTDGEYTIDTSLYIDYQGFIDGKNIITNNLSTEVIDKLNAVMQANKRKLNTDEFLKKVKSDVDKAENAIDNYYAEVIKLKYPEDDVEKKMGGLTKTALDMGDVLISAIKQADIDNSILKQAIEGLNKTEPLKLTFSSKIHLNVNYNDVYTALKTLNYEYKFSGFVDHVEHDHSIVIMIPDGYTINVKIDTLDKCIPHIHADVTEKIIKSENEISNLQQKIYAIEYKPVAEAEKSKLETEKKKLETEKSKLETEKSKLETEKKKLKSKLELVETLLGQGQGGASRRNRHNTKRIQRNRNSKRGYLTTTRKSRNQQKQTKNRKCPCASCRSMRR
jgi:hypothetical protein